MKYLCLYNDELNQIDLPAEYPDEAVVSDEYRNIVPVMENGVEVLKEILDPTPLHLFKKQMYDLEAMGRGYGWKAYMGDKPYQKEEP